MEIKKMAGVMYQIVFFARKTLFVTITFSLTKHPHIQIQLFIVSSVCFICYLNLNLIHETKFYRWLETVNECLFLWLCYHMIMQANLIV